MKYLAGMVLGISGAIALQATGLAQVHPSDTSISGESWPAVGTPSQWLVTEPISVDASNQATNAPSTLKTYDTARLKRASESLRANPGQGGKILNIIPPDLIRTPSTPATDTKAIDFFQVPRPNGGVGINLNTQ